MSIHLSYEIKIATDACPSNDELERLLSSVYVSSGYTTPEMAATRFSARAVRERGTLLVATTRNSQDPVGLVIVVPPSSQASLFASANEVEMHLLGVLAAHRGKGVGLALVQAAMQQARDDGFVRMLLWTQPTMEPAHNVYYKVGFVRDPSRDFRRSEDEEFLFMAADL